MNSSLVKLLTIDRHHFLRIGGRNNEAPVRVTLNMIESDFHDTQKLDNTQPCTRCYGFRYPYGFTGPGVPIRYTWVAHKDCPCIYGQFSAAKDSFHTDKKNKFIWLKPDEFKTAKCLNISNYCTTCGVKKRLKSCYQSVCNCEQEYDYPLAATGVKVPEEYLTGIGGVIAPFDPTDVTATCCCGDKDDPHYVWALDSCDCIEAKLYRYRCEYESALYVQKKPRVKEEKKKSMNESNIKIKILELDIKTLIDEILEKFQEDEIDFNDIQELQKRIWAKQRQINSHASCLRLHKHEWLL